MLTHALNGIASLFQATPAPGARARWELPGLLLLVAIGAVLRFWGLGSVGLHGDEETMAMPVMSIVERGTSELPSGMYYARAIGQLYMMAGSVQVFGESEWAFRLPSVLCGILLIALAWWVGRRFLTPVWNMALVAVVAFLPEFIDVAQTARMYVFLVASLAAYAGFVFAWERSGRTAHFIAALVTFFIALQFHILAIFGVFLFLFPGLLRGDRRMFAWGAGAVVLGLASYAVLSDWYQGFYPDSIASGLPDEAPGLVEARGGFLQALETGAAMIGIGIALAGALAFFGARRVTSGLPRIFTSLLLFAGLVCQLLMSYHLAALLLVAGGIVALRHERAALRGLLVVAIASVALAAIHIWSLHAGQAASLWKVVGALSGLPSFWTYLQLGRYSPVAFVLVWLGVAVVLMHLATGRRVSDLWLFFVLAVWLPLLGLGVFEWYVASRYTDFAVLPFLICSLAVLQSVWQRFGAQVGSYGVAVAASAGALLIVNPVVFARDWNAGYATHPDHKGAAEFIQSVQPGPRDILIAEDVLQQTYYLGRVNYWLLGKHVGLKYCEEIDGEALDFYTHTRLIGTGAELEALVARADRGAIYVIGSGEEQKDGRRFARRYGIAEVLASPAFQPVFTGRDGLTKVWKVAAPR